VLPGASTIVYVGITEGERESSREKERNPSHQCTPESPRERESLRERQPRDWEEADRRVRERDRNLRGRIEPKARSIERETRCLNHCVVEPVEPKPPTSATNSSSLTLSVFDLADPIRASTVGDSAELLGTGSGRSSRAASGLTRPNQAARPGEGAGRWSRGLTKLRGQLLGLAWCGRQTSGIVLPRGLTRPER
jgi:hypothetical protein